MQGCIYYFRLISDTVMFKQKITQNTKEKEDIMPDKDIIPVVNSTTAPQVCRKIDDNDAYKRYILRNDQWINPSSTDWKVVPTSFSDARSLYSFIQSGKKPPRLFSSTSSALSLVLASSVISASFIYFAAYETFASLGIVLKSIMVLLCFLAFLVAISVPASLITHQYSKKNGKVITQLDFKDFSSRYPSSLEMIDLHSIRKECTPQSPSASSRIFIYIVQECTQCLKEVGQAIECIEKLPSETVDTQKLQKSYDDYVSTLSFAVGNKDAISLDLLREYRNDLKEIAQEITLQSEEIVALYSSYKKEVEKSKEEYTLEMDNIKREMKQGDLNRADDMATSFMPLRRDD